MASKGFQIVSKDLSQKSLGTQVFTEVSSSALTLYPIAISGVCVAAGFLVNSVAFFIAVGAGVIGVAHWTFKYFFQYNKVANNIQKVHRKAFERELQLGVEDIAEKLSVVGQRRPAKQADYLYKGYVRLKANLKKNVSPEKIEYEQYLGHAEVMFFQAIQNLRLIHENVENMELIDIEDSMDRIRELEDQSGDKSREVALQYQQIQLVKEAKEHIGELTTEIEGAITALTEVAMSISNTAFTSESIKQDLKKATGKFMDVARMNKEIRDRVQKTMKELY
ncbi:hypothetical protein ACFL08_03040 [Patescibacteria group bacterium]